MKKLRVEGIPTWVVIFSIVLGLIGTVIGLIALFDQTSAVNYVEGADRIALTWGGRNVGIGLAMLVAVALRSAPAYVVTYLAALFKEGSDLADVLTADTGASDAISLVAFLAIELACFVLCLRAVLSSGNEQVVASA